MASSLRFATLTLLAEMSALPRLCGGARRGRLTSLHPLREIAQAVFRLALGELLGHVEVVPPMRAAC